MQAGKFTSTAHAIRFAMAKLDEQGERCSGETISEHGEGYNSCLYHRADGARCIVGWMLTETQARIATSWPGVYDWNTDKLDQIAPDAWDHRMALVDLQNFHDDGWGGERGETFSAYVRKHVDLLTHPDLWQLIEG